jgi:hypothetical protein
MIPETQSKVEEWKKAMNPDVAKKLFLRESARKAYSAGNGEIAKITSETLKEVIDIITVGKMTHDEIGEHISNLEKARALLATLGQGFQIAFAEEKEPEFRAKHEAREKARKLEGKSSSKNKTGVDLEALVASIMVNPKEFAPKESKNAKIKCETCGVEFFPVMKSFHKC